MRLNSWSLSSDSVWPAYFLLLVADRLPELVMIEGQLELMGPVGPNMPFV